MPNRGPLPTRNGVRVDRRSSRQNTVIRVTGKVTIPAALKDWHPIAKGWYQALKKDGQAVLYEPSDWHVARIIAQLISDEFSVPPEERVGARMGQIFGLLKQIYGTPDARQRAHIEIHRVPETEAEEQPPKPTREEKMEEFRQRLRGSVN